MGLAQRGKHCIGGPKHIGAQVSALGWPPALAFMTSGRPLTA
jgi:hypothetical protein